MQLVYGLLFVVLIALQVRLWFGDGSMEEVFALKRQLATQQAEVDDLRERNATLQAEVDDLKDGLAAIEARARSELGLIREGETYYQLLPSETMSRE
ncbi:MAG: cell division protein FtsB [Gammaproteobacteria bacterium]|nr:cell division protein FtsB [Gammaproteobacteria bacterium]